MRSSKLLLRSSALFLRSSARLVRSPALVSRSSALPSTQPAPSQPSVDLAEDGDVASSQEGQEIHVDGSSFALPEDDDDDELGP